MVVKRRSVSKKRKTVSKRKTNSKRKPVKRSVSKRKTNSQRKPVKRSVSKRKTNSKRKPVKRSVSKRKTNSKRKPVKRSVSKRKIKGGSTINPEQLKEVWRMKSFTIKITDGNGQELSYTLDKEQSKYRIFSEEGYLVYKNQTNATFEPVLKSDFIKNNIILEYKKKVSNTNKTIEIFPLGNGLISRKNGKNKNEYGERLITNLTVKNNSTEQKNLSNNISMFPIYKKDGYIFYLVVEFSEEKKLFVSLPKTYIKDIPYIVAKKAVAQNKSNP